MELGHKKLRVPVTYMEQTLKTNKVHDYHLFKAHVSCLNSMQGAIDVVRRRYIIVKTEQENQ